VSWASVNKEFIPPRISRILYHNLTFDIPTYIDLAQEFGSPILELGAGLGRISQALLKEKYSVTALECIPQYCEELEHLRSHLAPEVQDNFKILCQDMSKGAFKDNFGLILLPLRTVGLLTNEERHATFEKVFSHLHPNGAFAFHLPCFLPEQATKVWNHAQELKTDLGWLEIDEMLNFDFSNQVYNLRQRIHQYNDQNQLIGTWRVAYNLLALDIIDIQQELAEAGFSGIRVQDLAKDKLVVAIK
jgi:tRNA A58 N-methylase Trm61